MKKSKVLFIGVILSLALTACGNSTDTPSKITDVQPEVADIHVTENSTSKKNEDGEGIIGVETDSQLPDIESDTFSEKLISFGFTENEAVENAKILKQCGIPTIDICEPTDPNATIDGLIVFRGKLDDDRIFMFTVDSRKIFYVSFNGEDLYDSDKGGYLKNFDDVHIPEKEITLSVSENLRDRTESVLDKYFTKTRYYDAWGYAREDNNYMVQCQATDGSILTDNWIVCRVWYEQQENGDFTVTGVKINGTSYEIKQ